MGSIGVTFAKGPKQHVCGGPLFKKSLKVESLLRLQFQLRWYLHHNKKGTTFLQFSVVILIESSHIPPCNGATSGMNFNMIPCKLECSFKSGYLNSFLLSFYAKVFALSDKTVPGIPLRAQKTTLNGTDESYYFKVFCLMA